MHKVILMASIIPYIYISMFALWTSNSIVAAVIFILILLLPIFLAYHYGRNDMKNKFILTSIISGGISIVLVYITNALNITNEWGETWHGHFKPFYSEQFALIIFVCLFVIQTIVYLIALQKNNN